MCSFNTKKRKVYSKDENIIFFLKKTTKQNKLNKRKVFMSYVSRSYLDGLCNSNNSNNNCNYEDV